jgi:transposase
MPKTADQTQAQTTPLVDLGAIFVLLELSKSTWLLTALSPGSEKMVM